MVNETESNRRQPFADSYAQRIVTVIDGRIERDVRSGARVEQTWGTVAGLSGNGMLASVYLYGEDTNASEGFRVRLTDKLSIGDKVMVSTDARGDRWVTERYSTTAYRKVEIDMATGDILTGDGTAPPTARVTAAGVSLAHSALTGVTADQHHAQAHDHSSASDDNTIAPVDVTIGSTPDIKLSRTGTKTLTIDDGAGGAITVALPVTSALVFGGDAVLSRGAANRLDLASGDSLRIVSGELQFGANTIVDSSASGLLRVLAPAATESRVLIESPSGQRAGLKVWITGDTVARAVLSGDATITGLELGPGSGAADTNLYRSAADSLKTDDAFIAGKSGGGKDQIQIVSGTSGAGMTIGGDVTLYRSAADVLKTDDNFHATSGMKIVGSNYASLTVGPETGQRGFIDHDTGGSGIFRIGQFDSGGTFRIGIIIDGQSGPKLGFFGNSAAARTTYGAPTTTVDRATFSDSVTLGELAQRVGTLIADLRTLGLLG